MSQTSGNQSAAVSPQQAPWYRPNQIPVRAVQLQQHKPVQFEPRGLSRQLSAASVGTTVSTTAGSTAGHVSGYDTSTTHRFLLL